MARLLQMTGPVVDLVYKVREFPRSGQEAVVTGFAMLPGGGFNAMVAARAAGMEVSLGGSLGQGPFADAVAGAMAEHGISIARPRTTADQGCCTVLMEPDGERSFVAAPGAEGQITATDLAAIDLSDIDWVMISGYTLHYPGANEAVARWIAALPREVAVIFDPSPMVAHLPLDLLAMVMDRADWISANAEEAAHLVGAAPEQAAALLAASRQGAVVRMGAEGCILATETVHRITGHAVAAIDTNGAGDTHIGSFVAELARSGDPLRAARYANIAAALSTTREGPATAPGRAEVTALIPEDR